MHFVDIQRALYQVHDGVALLHDQISARIYQHKLAATRIQQSLYQVYEAIDRLRAQIPSKVQQRKKIFEKKQAESDPETQKREFIESFNEIFREQRGDAASPDQQKRALQIWEGSKRKKSAQEVYTALTTEEEEARKRQEKQRREEREAREKVKRTKEQAFEEEYRQVFGVEPPEQALWKRQQIAQRLGKSGVTPNAENVVEVMRLIQQKEYSQENAVKQVQEEDDEESDE